MSETASPRHAPKPPLVASERVMLDAWLDFHRDILLWKCEGLGPSDLARRTVDPSTLSLIALVRHMAEVERSWFRRRIAGEDVPTIYDYSTNEDADFDDVDPARVNEDLASFRAEVEQCRAVTARIDDLDSEGGTFDGRPLSLRWVYVHMIEEYARHNGHADLIRERIDGVTGDWPEE